MSIDAGLQLIEHAAQRAGAVLLPRQKFCLNCMVYPVFQVFTSSTCAILVCRPCPISTPPWVTSTVPSV